MGQESRAGARPEETSILMQHRRKGDDVTRISRMWGWDEGSQREEGES